MYKGGISLENIHLILENIRICEQNDVLATIIHVEGSSYRKAGTTMLFREDGNRIGVLSAGCLEEDLAARTNKMNKANLSQSVTFDLKSEDDMSWGQGAGCNGVITVLLEPVTSEIRSHLMTLQQYLQSGNSVTVIKKLTDSHQAVTDYLYITSNGDTFGNWESFIPNVLKQMSVLSQQGKMKSGLQFVDLLQSNVYIHCFHPKPRLVLFGAGPDAIPLARIASQTGFSVAVIDWRPSLCNKANFPDADELYIGFPAEVVNSLHLSSSDYIVILTHSFQRDKELLQLLSHFKLGYIGVLGSTLRTKRLLMGYDLPSAIHSPVGISIGAEGPEEIAISILAEIISIKNKSQIDKAVSV